MRDIIIDFLKRQDIRSVLRKEEWKSDINLFLLDFFGKDDRYHSFFILYNKTQIFCKSEGNLLGNTSQVMSLDNKLQNGLLSFDTHKAYLDGRWKFDKRVMSLLLNSMKDALAKLIEIESSGDFEIMRVEIELKLFYGLIVYYRFKGIPQDPIVYKYDSINNVRLSLSEEDAKDLINMFVSAGIDDIVWECKYV